MCSSCNSFGDSGSNWWFIIIFAIILIWCFGNNGSNSCGGNSCGNDNCCGGCNNNGCCR